jgi:uncharacterized protein (DUF1684 family)
MTRGLEETWRRLGLSALMVAILTIAISFTGMSLPGTSLSAAQDAPAAIPAAAATSSDNGAWLEDLAVWRTEREQKIDAPDGWLTLADLEWLKPGINAVGAAGDNQIQIHSNSPAHVCVLNVDREAVALQAPEEGFPPDLQIDGQPAQEGTLIGPGANSSIITSGSLTLLVVRHGNRFSLRIKNANSRTRTAFHGLNWYAPDPRFRVVAHWIPYTPPRIEKIPTSDGATLDLPAPGVAEFTLTAKTMRLEAVIQEPVIQDPAGKTLFFILRDQTNGDSTYDAARYLHTGLPDHGLDKPGLLTLDFNRLENPPCAYTTYANCPLPPVSNRLLVRVEAGEKQYQR